MAAMSALPSFVRPHTSFAQEIQPQPTPNEDETASIAKVASDFMRDYKVPGLSVAIARHGQFVYRNGFGRADQNTRETVTPTHLFRIASVTKPITSVAIFSLMEKGRLSLTDLIFGSNGLLQFDYGRKYDGRIERITLEHLLTHTCGGWGNTRNDPMFSNSAMGTKNLIQWTLKNIPLEEEPGTHYAYSNFGYCILGRVLEKITGQPYSDFVQQAVLSKCDIKDMRIAGNALQERSPKEVIYYGNGDDPYGFNIRRMDSHGGWIATPSDLVQVLMHVDGFSYTPNILDKKTIAIMTTPSAVSASSHYAKGWAVNSAPNWWHVGSLPGSVTVVVRTASGLCWAAFTNTRTPGMEAALDQMMWKMVKSVPSWRA